MADFKSSRAARQRVPGLTGRNPMASRLNSGAGLLWPPAAKGFSRFYVDVHTRHYSVICCCFGELIILIAPGFLRRDASIGIACICYGNVAGWMAGCLAGCLSQPVLYQND